MLGKIHGHKRAAALIEILPPWPLLAAFLVASFILAATPGPGVLYIVTRSISQGRTAGFASIAGVALGNYLNAVCAAIGLAALLTVSSAAFLMVKYAGALYLVYLGIKAIRSRTVFDIRGPAERTILLPVFRDGFIVALLNPKTALFFAAFLPQFMTPGSAPLLQSAALGALFVAIATVTDTGYVMAAGSIAGRVSRAHRTRRIGRFAVGGTFIGLGVLAAVGGPGRRS
jgi:threonine/homoserine/homoserine lactone efflux protein